MKEANYAPVYAAIYPVLAKLFRAGGYALCIHGTMARDFDLVAVPWIEAVSSPEAIVEEACRKFAIKQIGEWSMKKHGRRCVVLSIGHGECAIDLSVMPASSDLTID